MLTRLKVTGLKNLVDVHFGPFTCIAGPNRFDLPTLFDAIRFLSALADRTFVDAAKSVRDESGRTGNARALFHKVGDKIAGEMTFEAEMIIPQDGIDDLGLAARANATFLRYTLTLGLRGASAQSAIGDLELLTEELTYIKPAEFKHRLRFPREVAWQESVVRFQNRKSPFISTNGRGDDRKVLLHLDGGVGKPTSRPARQLPRTILSASNASESPMALLARREMQSWRLLQLEPTSRLYGSRTSSRPRAGSGPTAPTCRRPYTGWRRPARTCTSAWRVDSSS